MHETWQFDCPWNIAVCLSMKYCSFIVHETWQFHCPWNMEVSLSMKHGSFTVHETWQFHWPWNWHTFLLGMKLYLFCKPGRYSFKQIFFYFKFYSHWNCLYSFLLCLLGLQSTEGLVLPTLTCQVRYTSKSIGPYGYTKLETPDPVRTLKWCNLGHG